MTPEKPTVVEQPEQYQNEVVPETETKKSKNNKLIISLGAGAALIATGLAALVGGNGASENHNAAPPAATTSVEASPSAGETQPSKALSVTETDAYKALTPDQQAKVNTYNQMPMEQWKALSKSEQMTYSEFLFEAYRDNAIEQLIKSSDIVEKWGGNNTYTNNLNTYKNSSLYNITPQSTGVNALMNINLAYATAYYMLAPKDSTVVDPSQRPNAQKLLDGYSTDKSAKPTKWYTEMTTAISTATSLDPKHDPIPLLIGEKSDKEHSMWGNGSEPIIKDVLYLRYDTRYNQPGADGHIHPTELLTAIGKVNYVEIRGAKRVGWNYILDGTSPDEPSAVVSLNLNTLE